MRQFTGFTLIELVVAIALLAVLIAFAIPRFADLESETRIAALQNMRGTVQSASTLVYARSRALGNTQGSGTVDFGDGRVIPTRSGFAQANWNRAVRYMLNLDSVSFSSATAVCNLDWCGRGFQRNIPTDAGTINTSGRGAKVWPRGYRWIDLCAVHYINHEDGSRPEIGISTSDC